MSQNKDGSGKVDIDVKTDINLHSVYKGLMTVGAYYDAGTAESSLKAGGKISLSMTGEQIPEGAQPSSVVGITDQWSAAGKGNAKLSISGDKGVAINGIQGGISNTRNADSGTSELNITSSAGDVTITTGMNGITSSIKEGSQTNAKMTLTGRNVTVESGNQAVVLKNNTAFTAASNTNGGTVKLTGKSGTAAIVSGDNTTLTVGDGKNETNFVSNGQIQVSKNAGVTLNGKTTTYVDANALQKQPLFYVSDGGKVNADKGASLYVTNLKKGDTLNLINDATGSALWQTGNVKSDNNFLNLDFTDGQLVVDKTTKSTKDALGASTAIDHSVAQAGSDGTGALYAFANGLISDASLTPADKAAAVNAAANAAELGGAAHGTYTASGLFADAIARHSASAEQNVWAAGFHNKANVDGLSLAGTDADYDGQINGAVAGVDFYRKDGKAAGIAFAYGDGSFSGTNGAAYTKNEADYRGVALYGSADRGSYKLAGDISYLSGDNDITQKNHGTTVTAKPDTEAWSVGVKAAKDYAAGDAGTLTAYAGARYLRLSTGSYTSSLGLHYEGEDQNLFLLPVGVDFSAAIDHGAWKVRPYVGAGYVWTLGDRSADQTVSYGAGIDTITFDTADAGSFVAKAGVATDSEYASYGIGYTWQKGDSSSNNTWTVSASYKF